MFVAPPFRESASSSQRYRNIALLFLGENGRAYLPSPCNLDGATAAQTKIKNAIFQIGIPVHWDLSGLLAAEEATGTTATTTAATTTTTTTATAAGEGKATGRRTRGGSGGGTSWIRSVLSGAVGGGKATSSSTFRGKTSSTASNSNGQGKSGSVKGTLAVAGGVSQREDSAAGPGGAEGHGAHAGNSEVAGGEKKPVPHGSVAGRLAPQVLLCTLRM